MFQKDLLKNKRILVSGGGSGLGKAMAQQMRYTPFILHMLPKHV